MSKLKFYTSITKKLDANLAFTKKLLSSVVSSSNKSWTQSFSLLDSHNFLPPILCLHFRTK